MVKISPIAEYLRVNKAISKPDNNGCHFFSPDGLYLGRLTKSYVNNYRVIQIETFGEGLKKMYSKTLVFGQQFIYAKNPTSPLGVSLLPLKTYMRKAFVNFIDGTSHIVDTQKNLKNKLDLLVLDKETNVGLYDLEKPFEYSTITNYNKLSKLRRPIFKYTTH